ncbi:MAG: dihydrolipoyl dehydrogenase [bacterium]
MKKYDVAIIGAGTAGLSARKEVAKKTDNYVVIDPGALGTTCARVGCMPSKVLIQTANDFHRRGVYSELGINGSEKLAVDYHKVMNHVRSLRDRFVSGVVKDIASWREGHLVQKRARFIDANTLDLEGETIKADRIIIATGSRPVMPESWKQYEKYIIDTDHFFESDELPDTIAIIGLGVIGLELGQALSRLGKKVIGIDRNQNIGILSDPEMKNYAQEVFAKEFEMHFTGAQIVGEGENGLIVKSGEHKWEFEKVFLTMGRQPNIDNLGLEDIGVAFNDRKIPVYDSDDYKIKDFPIYLVGDVNGDRPILHEAADEGRIAGYNSLRDQKQCFLRRTHLGIVFSDPNIALVGKSYQMLRDEEANFVIGKVSFERQGRALVKMKNKGLLHVYAQRKTGKILGAEIFAPEGEHLAHLLAWAITLKLSVFDALTLPYYHPVLEEGLRTALRDAAAQIEKQAPNMEVLRCQDPPVGS